MLDELYILKHLLPSLSQSESVRIGPGDDCAALEFGNGSLLLAAVDQLIGDRHYWRDTTVPALAGAKLMKRNLSDIAAMGGTARWALLTVAANGRTPDWILEFCRGVADAGKPWGVSVIGGDLAECAMAGEVSTLTILGEVPAGEVVRRGGAQPGDRVFVTGALGNSLAGHHLTFSPRLPEGRFLASHGFARAMLDISDGLLLDASRLAAASGVRLVLTPPLLPLREGADVAGALGDGEDYELLFTVPPAREAELMANWPLEFAPLTMIGVVEKGEGVVDANGENLLWNRKIGYEH